MSKKWMAVAGVVALVAVVLVAALLLTSCKASSRNTPGTGATSSTATSATTSGGTSANSTVTLTQGQTTPGGSSTTSAGGTTGSKTNSEAGPLKPFPHLPDPGVPAEKLTSPAAPGQTLPPLTEAPSATMYALKLGELFSRAQYTIVMRPYGLGPDSIWGSGLVIRVDSATPVGKTPAYKKIVNANLLVIADTTNGGTVTKGGTYKATLTFRSDGSKLLPILSQATLTK